TVHWPTGEAAVGNAGLAELVKKTENSISYLELNYAIQEKLTYGFVRNAAGNAEKPDFKAMGAAMNAIEGVRAAFRSSSVTSPAAGAYPSCDFTCLIVPHHIEDPGNLLEMKNCFRWGFGPDGHQIALHLAYVVCEGPFPDRVREQTEKSK